MHVYKGIHICTNTSLSAQVSAASARTLSPFFCYCVKMQGKKGRKQWAWCVHLLCWTKQTHSVNMHISHSNLHSLTHLNMQMFPGTKALTSCYYTIPVGAETRLWKDMRGGRTRDRRVVLQSCRGDVCTCSKAAWMLLISTEECWRGTVVFLSLLTRMWAVPGHCGSGLMQGMSPWYWQKGCFFLLFEETNTWAY